MSKEAEVRSDGEEGETNADDDQDESFSLLELTVAIVTSHVEHNRVHAAELPQLIKTVHATLAGLGTPATPAAPEARKPVAAVGARKSLADPTRIISMIDGKPYKTLKRHIGRHGYTPESYREAFGLDRDYPMVAPAFADERRAIAHRIGLGQKKDAPVADTPMVETPRPKTAPEPAKKPVKRGRKKASDALATAREHLPS